MSRKSFKSDAFLFTPTAMSLAMGRAGSDRPTQFARVPKAMEVHADGKRVVIGA